MSEAFNVRSSPRRARVEMVGRGFPPGDLLPPASEAVRVGSKAPPSIPQMRGTNLGRGQDRPPRIIPELGQVSEDNPKGAVIKDSWGVFQHDEAGSNNAGDS
jgi:hypothetical protein